MSALGHYLLTHSTEVRGWRGWVYDDDTGLLRSGTENGLWRPGEVAIATCHAHRYKLDYSRSGINTGRPVDPPLHVAPEPSCTCGIHAHARPDSDPLSAEVSGVVRLWGRVAHHENGYRASHAYPLSLWVHEDGGVDGAARAEQIAERLRAYDLEVGVLGYDFIDDQIASELRAQPVRESFARIARLSRTAREHLDHGDHDAAFAVVLDEVRACDLSALNPGRRMDQALPGPVFVHSRTSRRWAHTVEGEPGHQVLTITSLSGQAPIYYGPQSVTLDTSTGAVSERFAHCAGPRHRGHHPAWSLHRDSELTIRRIGPSLRLETWIQVLLWHADPAVRERTQLLREARW